jgi:hypothetical protein
LIASIYDKALKRKDYSGIIDNQKVQDVADKKIADAEAANGVSGKPSSMYVAALLLSMHGQVIRRRRRRSKKPKKVSQMIPVLALILGRLLI